jgi:hypothetical protein
MKWRKLGLIFQSAGQREWMQTHASVPFAEHLVDDIFRIYFTPRDSQNRSHIGTFDIDLNDPQKIFHLSEEPVLGPGPLGHFDDSGAMGSWLVETKYERRLYYIGWNIGKLVPYRSSIGLAVAKKGKGGFIKYHGAPVHDRNPEDPLFVSTPCVLLDRDVWKMWYMSGIEWRQEEGKVPWAPYHLKYAESPDGIRWIPQGVALDFFHPKEIAIARPCVVKDKKGYHMWYSYRGTDYTYRIGYAMSKDGKAWDRRDDFVGIEPSKEGWDSEMIAYPFIFDHKGGRYMLYCGNGFSQGGIGLAILEK